MVTSLSREPCAKADDQLTEGRQEPSTLQMVQYRFTMFGNFRWIPRCSLLRESSRVSVSKLLNPGVSWI